MEAIETKEIPGVSIKSLIALIVSTASIMITVLNSYSNLKGLIVTNKMEIDSKIELMQYQLQGLKEEQSLLKVQLKDFATKLDDNRAQKNK